MQQSTNTSRTSEVHPIEQVADLAVSTFSYEERRAILPAVQEALDHCGCWLLDRRPTSFSQMEFLFELHAYAVVDIYAALIAAGLELTRASHETLTTLCAVRRHDLRPSKLPVLITVRLEVSFLDDLSPGVRGSYVATA